MLMNRTPLNATELKRNGVVTSVQAERTKSQIGLDIIDLRSVKPAQGG